MYGIWSCEHPSVEIESTADLDRFIDNADFGAGFPVAISIEAHGYRADLLVAHSLSFVHLTPDDLSNPYYVTVGGPEEGGVDFWLQSCHHTWFPASYLVAKASAREAFREFVQTGTLSPIVKWEEYYA
jgi:hypothetical protein